MKIGVIKEIKYKEHRVALTPAGTRTFIKGYVTSQPVAEALCLLAQFREFGTL